MSLEVKNLTKKYGEKIVVEGLNFTMDKPGIYALLGTNGAGKTTTIRMMLDMIAKNDGEVLWNGKRLNTRELNIGYLAEERGLYPKTELMEQLLYFAKLKNVEKNEAKKRIAYLAKRFEVEEYIYPDSKRTKVPGIKMRGKKVQSKKAEQLSKGNQQKIQMIVALLSDPELLVLDEPLSGLDPINADLFKSILREEIDKGKYMIMSSHQMEVIEEFCENITILNRGKAVLQGNLNEIKKSYGRVNLYVKCEGDISDILSGMNLPLVNQTAKGYFIKVGKEEQASKILERLVAKNIPIIHYELREPSLHEIFVERTTVYE